MINHAIEELGLEKKAKKGKEKKELKLEGKMKEKALGYLGRQQVK